MQNDNLANQILETALAMADSSSWETLHLYSIAERLGISLDQIRQYYPQKDDIVEAWFDCADKAVLQITPSPDFLERSVSDRLHQVIMTWFEALAPHRRVTRQMLMYKFEIGHIHLQVLGIMRVSRTVQWFRESAQVDTTGLRRILEEIGTTTIYLMSFARWLGDESPGAWKTRDFLAGALRKAGQCGNKVSFE